MADDWKPGDYALCVNAEFIRNCAGSGWFHAGRTCPPKGSVREVSETGFTSPFGPAPCGCISLIFFDGSSGASCRFRKATPPAADEFDRETIALLNGTPVPVEA